jgi:uncharacterized DUF497 family protein
MQNRRIVWDEKKNKHNQAKHRISFEEAASVFFDPLNLTVNDESHSFYEYRFFTIGKTREQRLIVIFYTETDEEIRIISARRPTRSERMNYEEER